MNRKLKNIVMIIIMISICVLMFLTMNYAKNNLKSTNDNSPMNDILEKDDNIPSINDENIPEKPNDNGTSINDENIPERPDDNIPSINDRNMPEKPDNNRPNMENSSDMMNQNNVRITYIYYIIFGLESLVFVSILVYFIMSNLNKKSLKETYINNDKILIYVLLVIILSTSITLLDSIVANKLLSNNNFNNINENKNINSNNSNSITYNGVEEIIEDTKLDSGNFDSNESDENALLISGNINVDIENISVNKTGDSNGGDDTSFYGINSGIIAKDSASLNLENITVTTDAVGANGVFSYGGSATTNNSKSDGTIINISNSKVTTTSDNSGGIMTTGGGIMNTNNLEVTTSGTSSAAIRTDRGGGTVTVNKGIYKTTGIGSPSIYSTANITLMMQN